MTASTVWHTDEGVRSRLIDWLRQHGQFQMKDAPKPGDGNDLVVQNTYGAVHRIAVRGFPEPADPNQARDGFASAVLDLVINRNEGTDIGLALALPDGVATYTTLVSQSKWLRDTMPLTIYWVAESGAVRTE